MGVVPFSDAQGAKFIAHGLLCRVYATGADRLGCGTRLPRSLRRRSCPLSAGRRTLPEVSRSQTVRRLLVVEARDLDTDERTRREIEVETPSDEAGQRAQLATVVGHLHPDARMRSFGGQAASFLDAVHLVVAHYGPALDEPIRSSDDHLVTEQQPLFAA